MIDNPPKMHIESKRNFTSLISKFANNPIKKRMKIYSRSKMLSSFHLTRFDGSKKSAKKVNINRETVKLSQAVQMRIRRIIAAGNRLQYQKFLKRFAPMHCLQEGLSVLPLRLV